MPENPENINVGKSAPKYKSEGYFRERMLAHVTEKYAEITAEADGVILGIACELTGIEDPSTALRELVLDSLNKWARIQAIELFLTEQKPISDFREEYVEVEKVSDSLDDVPNKEEQQD